MQTSKTHVNALTLATFGMLSGSAFAQNSISVYIAPQGSAHATVASAYTSSSSQNAVEPGFLTKLQTDTINSQKFTKLSNESQTVGRLYHYNEPTTNFSANFVANSYASYSGDYSERSTYDHLIRESAARHGVDPALIKAVIHTESSFNPNVRSRMGAMGLMQLMPGTARDMGVYNAWDPAQNIEGGTKYLAYLQHQFSNPNHVIAAYNAGPGNVKKYGGIPPFRETKNYVIKVNDRYNNIYRMDAALYQGYDANRTMLAMNSTPVAQVKTTTTSYAQPITQRAPANPVINRDASAHIYFSNNE